MIDNLETILRHRLRLVRLLENKLVASDCELECHVSSSVMDINLDEIHLHFAAMKLWLDDFFDTGLVYNPDTEMDTSWISLMENNVIMTPGDPMDHLMTAVIHSKLNAIGGNVVTVKRTHFFTDTSSGFSNAMTGSTDDWLPTMTEWMGMRHFHKNPWWHRADASTIDLQPKPDDDLLKIPDIGINLVDMLRSGSSDATVTDSKPAEIVKPKFKPRLVTPDDD